MNRIHLVEVEDIPWFPAAIRQPMMDFLTFVSSTLRPFQPAGTLLNTLLRRSGATRIVDLCSGSAGPLLGLCGELESRQIILTDKFPNLRAFQLAQRKSQGKISFLHSSVDAMRVPESLEGVRTLFNAFHHFTPKNAKRILEDAAKNRQPIAIFEGISRSFLPLLLVMTLPIYVLVMTPFIRPFCWKRIVFTYIVPLIPVFVTWDGFVSWLRIYSLRELGHLTSSISVPGYAWEMGRLRVPKTPFYVTYLIGYPEQASPHLS